MENSRLFQTTKRTLTEQFFLTRKAMGTKIESENTQKRKTTATYESQRKGEETTQGRFAMLRHQIDFS